MKRRSQKNTKKKSGRYSAKVKAGTHPIIRHEDYKGKFNK